MYALVNTMSESSDTYGRIISRHRTIEAAESADSSLQRSIKRANGSSSYLPTVIVELPAGCRDNRGRWAYTHSCRLVSQAEVYGWDDDEGERALDEAACEA